MSSAELTITVGVLAGAVAAGSYLWQRHRSGTLSPARDGLAVILMIGFLAAFGYVLLADPSPARTSALLVTLAGGATYVVLRSESRIGRISGALLLVAAAAGLVAALIRQLV